MPSRTEAAVGSESDGLLEMIQHAAHLLPAQGPITVFVHHNTLHAFDHLPFDDGVLVGMRRFHASPYLNEATYRRALEKGRIHRHDIAEVLLDDLGDDGDQLVGLFGTRYHIRLAMIQCPLEIAPTSQIRWFIANTDALRRFRSDTPTEVRERMIRETRHWVLRDLVGRTAKSESETARRARKSLANLLDSHDAAHLDRWDDSNWESFALQALWRCCHQGCHGLPTPPEFVAATRPRDWLYEATGVDVDLQVHDVLIPFCAAFLDQGLALWQLPDRDKGFFAAFSAMFRKERSPLERWRRGLARELDRIAEEGLTPLAVISQELARLGVDQAHREEFIIDSLLALRGWTGMIWQLETRGDRVGHPAPTGTLVEFLAVRLLLDRLATEAVARKELGHDGTMAEIKHLARVRGTVHELHGVEQRAFVVFQLAQMLGWTPAALYSLSKEQWRSLIHEIESFSSIERRRVYHQAYERHFYVQALDAMIHRSRSPVTRPAPTVQWICCIDDREESIRRHLEEIDPTVETFGAAGFFGVAMYYRGAGDAHYVPLCPIVIRPNHYVRETVPKSLLDMHQRRGKIRRLIGQVTHQVHSNSRSFATGAILSGLMGPLATIPMVVRVLFPRFTGGLRKRVIRWVQPPRTTQIERERTAPDPGPEDQHVGFTLEEMTNIVQRLLEEIGLVRNFSRLIVVCGHGSSSLNNPHESAYNCGACGGSRGGPNARTFVQMANDPRVRSLLAERGFAIPAETYFLGAYHDTCRDSVEYYDLEDLPASHREDLASIRETVYEARRRNAHERCRRFYSAPLGISEADALRHVESRAEDLAQVRPEFNHATNALCIVGRRERTLGLFLDRRAFLVSYNSKIDGPTTPILARILQAVIPVCSGINLEYYFSTVDPVGWGCGSKLPHNITSLVGVMEGAASDLRPGLSQQMVEIHEPVRLLFIIEATAETMLRLMDEQPLMGRLCRNGWIRLAVLDPDSPAIQYFHGDRFEPYVPESDEIPTRSCSADWYGGWREHLGFAHIDPKAKSAGPEGIHREVR